MEIIIFIIIIVVVVVMIIIIIIIIIVMIYYLFNSEFSLYYLDLPGGDIYDPFLKNTIIHTIHLIRDL